MKGNRTRTMLPIMIAACLSAGGCGKDANPAGPGATHTPMDQADRFDLVGTWAVVAIEGAPIAVGPENSLWTFKADGTYEWFLDLDPYHVSGTGTYSFSGGSLSLTGIMVDEDVIGGTVVTLGLVVGNVSFFFRDADGDEWAYVKCR